MAEVACLVAAGAQMLSHGQQSHGVGNCPMSLVVWMELAG